MAKAPTTGGPHRGRGLVRATPKVGGPGTLPPPPLAGVHPLGPAVATLVAGRAKPGFPGVLPPLPSAELAQAAAGFARDAERLARDGARLIRKGRPGEAIAPL